MRAFLCIILAVVDVRDVSAGGGEGGVIVLGDETTIAQVHPRKFCERLWERITTTSTTNTPITTTLRPGRIVKAQTIPIAGATPPLLQITGVEFEDGTHLPADVLIVACGPWTYKANTWFDYGQIIPDITSVKCHSILVATPAVVVKGTTTTTAATKTDIIISSLYNSRFPDIDLSFFRFPFSTFFYF